MAKVNKQAAAKMARQGKQYYSGVVSGNRYHSHYDQGHDAYFNRTPYSEAWHPHKKQGWRAARDSDIQLLNQFCTVAARESVLNRLTENMKLAA